MGRIKSLMIKRAAKQLLQGKDVETSFTDSFETDKKLLGNNNLPDKKIRNKVAGYIAHLVKMKKYPRVIKPKAPEERPLRSPRHSRY